MYSSAVDILHLLLVADLQSVAKWTKHDAKLLLVSLLMAATNDTADSDIIAS